ncbi:Peroxisomal fatty acid beta-oxidation multifunctional [Musa troglodytarum]|uniref:Peroxisomal fatty acid beta-oxidation multifunctional n=1 Tax=Musa troglodytarum TaxID=320322 RepID=A0A9E7GYX4_9LILI|nr:Peroxisomal fatty acid beta-oxidation multifunctional [Musa troglodytarum]
MAAVRVTMEIGSDGVAVITICNPPVNALAPSSRSPSFPSYFSFLEFYLLIFVKISRLASLEDFHVLDLDLDLVVSVIAGLKEKYTEAMNSSDVKAIVLTGDGGKFSGGFDINVFTEIHKTDAPKPSVAAIQGLALGGGLEMAMGCHARVSTPEAQLGLPELSLGVIPGFGGTQRLPRLVGLPKALDMMLQSKSIIAKEGEKYGLIDAIVSPEDLLKISRCWALDIAERHKPWISSLRRTDRLCSLSEAHEILKAARQQVNRIAPNMPQHKECLDSVEEGVNFGGYAGVLKEAKVFKELVLSSTSKGLVHVFFAQRATSRVHSVTDVGLRPRKIKRVAVIGGGLMGSGIATALILSNTPVILKEIDSNFLQMGLKMIQANLEGLVKKGSLTQDKMNKALSLLKGVLDYSEFKHVDMAVIEKVSLKQSIFADLEKACPPHCILATNTSTIDLNIVGEKTRSQDRIIGAHFFSPAHVMPLLEIVRTDKTSPQVILDLMTIGKAIRKVPVVVGNCTGFAVNRTFFPYTQGAHLLVHLGVDVFRIDRVVSSFGMPMGPFHYNIYQRTVLTVPTQHIATVESDRLQDVAGYGVALAVKDIYDSAFQGRTFQSQLVELMVKSGRNGKNNGKGYYIYEKGQKPKPDPSVEAIIEESRRLSNVMPGGKPITINDQEVLEMIFFPVVNEACRVMDEGVVIRASDLDISSVLGMGFPRYRGGIIFWADTIGSGYIYAKLNKWAKFYGNFFKPSAYLEERATKGLPLVRN